MTDGHLHPGLFLAVQGFLGHFGAKMVILIIFCALQKYNYNGLEAWPFSYSHRTKKISDIPRHQ